MAIGAKADLSYRKLRAGVSVVDAQADVAYVLPAAFVQYIALKVEASLDTLNRNPIVFNSFVVVDQVAIEAIKTLSNSVNASDSQVFAVDKSLADSISFAENVHLLLIFIRDFADSIGVTDTQAIDFAKSLTDSTSTADAQVVDVAKLISDGVAINDLADIDDGIAFDFEASFTNMAFVSDAAVIDHDRVLSDSAEPLDAVALATAKALFDSAVPVDEIALAASIAKSDTISISESAAIFFERPVTDSISVAEALAKDAGKGLSDSASVDDAGSLIAQGYCDITYFAEDYVGEARTFT